MPLKQILVVEDETEIRELLGFTLERAGYCWHGAVDTVQAQSQINQHQPDLVILDWMLPGISGIDFARRLRRQPATRNLPIIMLTARGEEDDKVRGLDAGVDDFITKPFSPRELIARVKAILRRAAQDSAEQAVMFEQLKIDDSSHRVSVGAQSLDIGPTEYRLLYFFMTHPERVFSRAQLLDHVWGDDVYIEDRTVDVHIRRLRKVLAPHGYDKAVQTVRGAGYRFSKQF